MLEYSVFFETMRGLTGFHSFIDWAIRYCWNPSYRNWFELIQVGLLPALAMMLSQFQHSKKQAWFFLLVNFRKLLEASEAGGHAAIPALVPGSRRHRRRTTSRHVCDPGAGIRLALSRPRAHSFGCHDAWYTGIAPTHTLTCFCAS